MTAFRWFRAGKLRIPAERVGGLIMVGNLADGRPVSRGGTVVYARGSSADQKADLDRQVASGMREPPKTNGSSKKKFAGPDGWVARGYELEATWPADRGTVQGPLELCEVANEGGVLCLELTEALA